MIYWLPVVTSGRPPSGGLSRLSEAPSQALRSVLDAKADLLGLVAVGLGTASIAFACMAWRRRGRTPTEQAAMTTSLSQPAASPSGCGFENDEVPDDCCGPDGPVGPSCRA